MDPRIIEIGTLDEWLGTPPGQYLLDWEQQQLDRIVADLFGFHALQLGMPAIDGLRSNRMPYRWVGADQATSGRIDLVLDPAALPFPENSLDLVVLPHTLELSRDPHATLREVHRVLVPEGKVVICGFNPTSLWGFRQQRAHWYQRIGAERWFLPQTGEFIGYWRLRDWLRLLGLEIEGGRFGCYRPAVQTTRWLNRFAWMDKAGDRWWPILGSVYLLVATKKVHGMRLVERGWHASSRRVAQAAAPVGSGRVASAQNDANPGTHGAR
jgi:SAM-dependent methyltransferase